MNTRWTSHFKKSPAYFVSVLVIGFLWNCSKTTGDAGSQSASQEGTSVPQQVSVVPLGGNTWMAGSPSGGAVKTEGITGWTDKKTHFTAYVRIATPATFKVWLNLKVPEGESRIQLSALGVSKEITVQGSSPKDYLVGEWEVEATDTGYVAFKITGLSKTGPVFADIASLKLEGTAINSSIKYVKNNEGNFFYWGRRGPSVHLTYQMPKDSQAEWFYNEVTVPGGQDTIGSYFMAIGFDEGYFGIQVNSETERRVLFSVWSPYDTNNPKEVPKDQRIKLVKKGGGVHAGKFGNEGSGGQSYLQYHWEAGNTYKFLLHGKPNGDGSTTYTAYFYAPEKEKWKLIASFKRPQTNTWLTRFHSFLENFIPSQGNISRMVYFDNQWMRTQQGQWIELTRARFTADNTARKGYRMDYAGGVEEGHFYLKNCGFFSDYTSIDSWFNRPANGKKPDVNLTKLP